MVLAYGVVTMLPLEGAPYEVYLRSTGAAHARGP